MNYIRTKNKPHLFMTEISYIYYLYNMTSINIYLINVEKSHIIEFMVCNVK